MDSIDNNDNNKNNISNKDLYSILKKFTDYEDTTFDIKEVHICKNFDDDNDNIFIFNSKLSKYVKKNYKGEKLNNFDNLRHYIFYCIFILIIFIFFYFRIIFF